MPDDQPILRAEGLAAAKVLAPHLVQPHDRVNAPLLQSGQGGIRTEPAIGQQDIVFLELIPETAEKEALMDMQAARAAGVTAVYSILAAQLVRASTGAVFVTRAAITRATGWGEKQDAA